MRDFYAHFPFPDVVLNLARPPADVCSISDCVMGSDSGALGRVERFVDGGIVVHQMNDVGFLDKEILTTPNGTARIVEVVLA